MRLPLSLLFAFLTLPLLAQESPSLEKFEQALAKDPKDQSALYNAGLFTYLSGDFKKSIGYWQRLKELAPLDWKLRGKLIQAYEGAGMKRERDEEIAALRKERSSGKHEDLAAEKFFIRDQFEIGGIRAFVLEYFELEGERALVWKFILKKGEEQHDYYLSFGSYAGTTEMMRETGTIGKDERGYHLDGYGTDGSHRTYGILTKNPGYDEVKKMVIQVMEGKLKAQSSTVPRKNAEDEGK